MLKNIANIQETGRDTFPSTEDIKLEQQGMPSKWDKKASLSIQNLTESKVTHTNRKS